MNDVLERAECDGQKSRQGGEWRVLGKVLAI